MGFRGRLLKCRSGCVSGVSESHMESEFAKAFIVVVAGAESARRDEQGPVQKLRSPMVNV